MCRLLKCGHSSTLRLRVAGFEHWQASGWLSLPYSGGRSKVTILIGKSKASSAKHYTANTFHMEALSSINGNPRRLGCDSKKCMNWVWLISLLWGLKECFFIFIFYFPYMCNVLATASFPKHFKPTKNTSFFFFFFDSLIGMFWYWESSSRPHGEKIVIWFT